MKDILWHHFPLEKVFEAVKSNERGLSEVEAKERLKQSGLNELPKKKRLSKLEILFSQFKSILIYILLTAGVISFVVGEHLDAYVIFAAIFINVIVGYLQENKAQNELAKLQEVVVPKAKVIREGLEREIEAKLLVPGDILVLEAGDKVMADARIIDCRELEVNEAALTGESAPITKIYEELASGVVLAERRNMVYQGSQVNRGRGKAVIVATALGTQIGKIAVLLKETKETATPLQKKLNIFSRQLSFFILFISFVILLLGLLTGRDLIIMYKTAVALAVAAIPEGLAVAVTVILVIGMRKILKKQALVRKLVAAETLGSTTVICTDKTGTITEGEMRVTQIVTDSYDIEVGLNPLQITNSGIKEGWQLLKMGMLCNDAIIQDEDKALSERQIIGSSTEKALLLAAAQVGIKKVDLERESPRLDEIVFDSSRKYMATLHKFDQKSNLLLIKGASEIILEAASQILVGERPVRIYSDKRKELLGKFEALSKKGLRTLAIGYKLIPKEINQFKGYQEVLKKLVLVGFVGINDPLRVDVKETLAATQKAGLKTVIITGDNKITAKTIARQLEINDDDTMVMDGEQLLKLNDEELEKKVQEIKIYARVMPQDKLRIVEAWQKQGAVVAMTGDGINDAPALKKADIGIALGSGTAVAKETADLVLLNNSFNTIVAAIEQGRIIYDNIKKVVLYLLSDSFSEVIIVFGSLLLSWPLPLLPTQILWINLVTDSFPNIALTLEPGEKEVMDREPPEKNKPILDNQRKLLIGIISLVTALANLGIFYFFWQVIGDLTLARSVVFVSLGIDSLLYVFSCRSLRYSLFNTKLFSNGYLLLAVAFGALLQILAVYLPFFQKVLHLTPLTWYEWSLILAVSFFVILIIEIVKWIFVVRRK